MVADEKLFERSTEDEQNRFIRKVADLVRPMLGEIGEVLVKTHNRKKPGFVGLLFEHGQKVILFAEYVDQETRVENRDKTPRRPPKHVFEKDDYVKTLLKVGEQYDAGKREHLKLSQFGSYVKNAFRGFYKRAADGSQFKITLQGQALHKQGSVPKSILYFASKDGDQVTFQPGMVKTLAKLVEHLIRSALGMAAISNQELHSTVRYLIARLPQSSKSSFDDYRNFQGLATIYAFVREVVPFAPERRFPRIVGCEDQNVRQKLRWIQNASEIKVIRAVGGSLKGASVYSLRIVTSGQPGDSVTDYAAIAKFSTILEARAEADGLRRMQRYFSSIGKMLPPPLAVHLMGQKSGSHAKPKTYPDDLLKSECISVTPDLEGSVLSEKIAEHWALPTRRVERFSGYLRQARHFVQEIQRQPFDGRGEGLASASAPTGSNRERPNDQIIQFFGRSELEGQRLRLLVEGLQFPSQLCLRLNCKGCGTLKVVNPTAWIKQMLDNCAKVRWIKHAPRIQKVVLAHGDFHTGNLFYNTEKEQLTVLDYDRVSGERPEEDFSRLDASFVTFVFALDDFKRKNNWDKYAPSAISLVAGCHPSRVEALEKDAFARDLVEALAVIRPAKMCAFYAAAVIKALLIQLKSTYTKREGNGYRLADKADLVKNQGRNAATWLYLALMLGHLVEKDGKRMSLWKSPYESALPKS